MTAYGGRHKTRAAAAIAKQPVRLTNSGPEICWDDFCKSIVLFTDTPPPIKVRDDDGERYTFKPDRRTRLITDCLIYVDGPHHWTKRFRAKDDWEDRLILRTRPNVKILRVDSPLLTVKRYWPTVQAAHEKLLKLHDERVEGFAWTSADHRSARLYH